MKYIISCLILVQTVFFVGCNDQNLTDPTDNNSFLKLQLLTEDVAKETLTPFYPEFPSGYASEMIVGGTGLFQQPSSISFDLPSNAVIEKVYIYWVGRTNEDNGGDNSITVSGSEVVGELIGESVALAYTYRADITDLNLDFGSEIWISDVDFLGEYGREDGASIVVFYNFANKIIQNPSNSNNLRSNKGNLKRQKDIKAVKVGVNETSSFVDVRDGADFAFACKTEIEIAETVPQTYTFPLSEKDRKANLWLVVADAESESRPDAIWVTMDGILKEYKNYLYGNEGKELDVVNLNLVIPAGVTEITVQLVSGPDGVCGSEVEPSPESLLWLFGGLSINSAVTECTYTQGYWKNHPSAWPVYDLTLGQIKYNQNELLVIFNEPVRGNGLISLAHQLIAAKLNLMNGADATEVVSIIQDADNLIGSLEIPPVGTGKLKTDETESLVEMLDNYNNGVIGPGHCN